MTLQLAAALLLSMLTFWLPVGARIHIELLQAMIRSPWYLPLTGAAQLGMALSCLLLFRKRLMANRLRLVPAVLLILLTGLILPQGKCLLSSADCSPSPSGFCFSSSPS